MKILILGEYSGFVKNLTYGLTQFPDIEIVVFSDGDGFKDIKQDVRNFTYPVYSNSKLYGINIPKTHLLKGINSFLEFKRDIKQFKNYFDIVFLINPEFLRLKYWPFQPLFSIEDINYVMRKTGHIFLSSCGFDTANIRFMKKYRTQIIDHISSKYQNYIYRLLNKQAIRVADSVIPVSWIYSQSYREFGNCVKINSTIPLPFKYTDVLYSDNIVKNTIKIYNGARVKWKGKDYVDKALLIIKSKYGAAVEISEKRMPYNEFLQSLTDTNIYIDQCGDGYGMAAIIAMAAGCITFTGNSLQNEKEICSGESIPVIDIQYNVDDIVNKLEWWIAHPELMLKKGKDAREFVEKYHNPKKVAGEYLKLFESTIKE